MKHNTYIELLKKKYGQAIFNFLVETDTLKLKEGSAKELYYKEIEENNKAKVKELIPEYSNLIENAQWAFDFPGWIGGLDFSQNSAKEIMVIGLEPHIGFSKNNKNSRNFQATYGLRETDVNQFNEVDEYKANAKLWKNLHGIFGKPETTFKSREFLNKFYITDMCHFAVQGKASEVLKIKDWKKIRSKIASEFLLKEIELIQPQFIVSQSTDVANFVEKLLDEKGKRILKKSTREFLTDLPKKYVNSPTFKKYELNNQFVTHIRLPHLASGMTNDFWVPAQKELREVRLKGIKQELHEFALN